MFLALYTLFRSVNLALQVLAALPMAAIGAVTALVVTGSRSPWRAWSASSRSPASPRATAFC
jgi:multidrug efflux pump subunit AcrB